MKEREISLWELMTEMMLRWRIILVWMAVGAVLAGAVSYVRSNPAAESPWAKLYVSGDISIATARVSPPG